MQGVIFWCTADQHVLEAYGMARFMLMIYPLAQLSPIQPADLYWRNTRQTREPPILQGYVLCNATMQELEAANTQIKNTPSKEFWTFD